MGSEGGKVSDLFLSLGYLVYLAVKSYGVVGVDLPLTFIDRAGESARCLGVWRVIFTVAGAL